MKDSENGIKDFFGETGQSLRPKFKFRFHRGGFAESMKSAIDVNNESHLVEIIGTEYGFKVTEIDLTIKPYIYDQRLGKFTFIVLMSDGVWGFLWEKD